MEKENSICYCDTCIFFALIKEKEMEIKRTREVLKELRNLMKVIQKRGYLTPIVDKNKTL